MQVSSPCFYNWIRTTAALSFMLMDKETFAGSQELLKRVNTRGCCYALMFPLVLTMSLVQGQLL